MPRYIEQLTENITPASGDWLWIVDVSAEATDQDRKLSVGKLALATGISGGQTINGGTAANDDLTLEGTSHGTKTSSYVILQPTAGRVAIGKLFANATLDVAGGILGESIITTGVVRSGDGSAAAPLLQPGVDGDTGFFRPTNNAIGASTGGVEVMRWTSTANVLIGTQTDVTSARLQVGGTTGALLVSRLTTTQRGDLTAAVNGMILYNSSTNKFQGYENGEWVNLI